jgi:hypothetical protein
MRAVISTPLTGAELKRTVVEFAKEYETNGVCKTPATVI